MSTRPPDSGDRNVSADTFGPGAHAVSAFVPCALGASAAAQQRRALSGKLPSCENIVHGSNGSPERTPACSSSRWCERDRSCADRLVPLTALAVASPLAVIQPDGWVEDREHALLVVARVFVETELSPEGLLAVGVDRALDDAKTLGMTLVSRTDRVDHGQAIGDLVFAHPTGAKSHVHVIAANHDHTRVELLSASCLGTAAAFAACEASCRRSRFRSSPSGPRSTIGTSAASSPASWWWWSG